MSKYTEQIKRINEKLILAKQKDIDLKVFGSEKHKYEVNKPCSINEVIEFESKYSIELPECYKSFILEFGNGGVGWQNSAAGPYYGIYPFGENVNELIYTETYKYLKNECVLSPKMSDEYWNDLTKNFQVYGEDDSLDDENYDLIDESYDIESRKLWAGILPLGSQGCSYVHGLILNGKYKGRVVNLDIDRQKPQFAFENNFLDWYERWLDEVISGELIKDTSTWFGYTKGGTEEELLGFYLEAENLDEKNDNLNGLLTINKLNDQTLNRIEELIKNNFEPKKTLIQLICKSNYEISIKYLKDLVKTDFCSVLQFVYWYAKDKSNEWISEIEENISLIEDEETFRFCTYILIESKIDFGLIIKPFIHNNNEKIRVHAFYALGQLPNKSEYLEFFIEGLQDDSSSVLLSTLQALEGLKDKGLLIYFKLIAEKSIVNEEYILSNLNHRLKDYGHTHQTLLENKVDLNLTPENKYSKKKWFEFWK